VSVTGTVERLRAWKQRQAEERLVAGTLWQTHTYESVVVDPVFSQPDGRLVARQQIDKLLRRAAERIGIDATPRRPPYGGDDLYTVGTDIGDFARHVGHASPTTTSGCVASLGDLVAASRRQRR
jgi:hypothetical protein